MGRARDRHDPYRELFERSADAILIIEGDRFVDCNQATVDMLRYESKERFLQTHPSQLSPPTQPDGRASFEKANEMIAIAFEKGSHRFEWDHTRANGEVFPVEVLLTAVTSHGRRLLHVVWRDITDRRRLEEVVRQSQKMEALGRLAGGIAHDFNNLLVAISGSAELLRWKLGTDADSADLVHQIMDASARGAALVRELMTFSRQREVRPVIVDLGETLQGMQKILRHLVGDGVTLEIRVPEAPVRARLGAGHLEQVIMNLATNARDAMTPGGTLVVATRRQTVVDGHLTPGTYAVLSVQDDGAGMDAATARRAFDPFFTTKEVGKGTGLGLATVYAIAKQAGGAATIESAPGRGTILQVYFPVTEEPMAVAAEPASHAASRGTGTILLAEDDPGVAKVTTRILTGRGYRVIHAANGVAALDEWRTGRHVDLVLADVVMPRMGGPELMRALREGGFRGPVLFVSGYTDHGDQGAALPPDAELLAKPFTSAELLEVVCQALSRAAAKRQRE